MLQGERTEISFTDTPPNGCSPPQAQQLTGRFCWFSLTPLVAQTQGGSEEERMGRAARRGWSEGDAGCLLP